MDRKNTSHSANFQFWNGSDERSVFIDTGMYMYIKVHMHELNCALTYLCINVPSMNIHVHELTCPLCMSIPVHECTSVWTYLCINIPTVCMNVHVHERTCACTYILVHEGTYLCMNIHICIWMSLCMTIPVHERTYAWTYLCINITCTWMYIWILWDSALQSLKLIIFCKINNYLTEKNAILMVHYQ